MDLAEKGNWEMDDKLQVIEDEITHLIKRIQIELKPVPKQKTWNLPAKNGTTCGLRQEEG